MVEGPVRYRRMFEEGATWGIARTNTADPLPAPESVAFLKNMGLYKKGEQA